MNSLRNTRAQLSVILLIVFFSMLMTFTTVLNLPVTRQIVGFIYLTFVPGTVLVWLLGLRNLDFVEFILLSLGLSIAIVMVMGLVINELSHSIGVSQPLSSIYLLAALNGFVLLGAILGFARNRKRVFGDHRPDLRACASPFAFLCATTVLVLGIVGAVSVNMSESNVILLAMLLLSATVFGVGVLSKRFVRQGFYPLLLFSLAVALLFHSSLISNYVYGSDIHTEYYTFIQTQSNAFWDSSAFFSDSRFGRMNTMLSITILPTVYSNLLGLDGTWIFKLVFPFIFSFVSLGLYKTLRISFNSKTAFISVFLLMSEFTFYTEMIGLARQMIAELFFVLLFFVILTKKLNNVNRTILFAVFGIALVLSHYGMALIFLFFISLAWLYMHFKRKPGALSLTLVTFFFVAMFSWYIYTSGSATFESILSFLNNIQSSLGDFFNPASRGESVMRGLGMTGVQSYWQIPSRVFAYLTEFFIIIGFIDLATRIRKKLNLEYVILVSLAMMLLAMGIVVPAFASSLNMTRLYHILLFFLAPCFVLGCTATVKFFVKKKREIWVSILALVILGPYFLFQSGFVYELTGSDVWSVPLSKYRMSKLRLYSLGYVDELSVFGAQWMSKNLNTELAQVNSDSNSRYKVLSSYGMVYEGYIEVLSNTTFSSIYGVLFLSQLNMVYGIITGNFFVWNSSELSPFLGEMSKIYSNGGSEVYLSSLHTSNASNS